MSNRLRNNLLACLFVLVALIAFVLLAGCAGKGLQVEYIDGDGKAVTVDTDYQVENGFTMERDGDGYKIDLGSATTKDAEFGVISELVRALLGAYGIPVAGQAGAPAPVPGTGSLPMTSDQIFDAGVAEGRRLQTEEFNR